MNPGEFTGEPVDMGSKSVVLGDELDSGAEGAVYRVRRASDRVVKIFAEDDQQKKEPKVREMVANPPQDPTADRKDIESIIWPRDVVTKSSTGAFLGYAMSHLPVDQHKNAQRYAREDLQWDESTWEDRFKTALNIAGTVGVIHSQGHAMGDMNHQNILLKDGFVRLIDCDGFHISGETENYDGETVFGRYAPPEGRGAGFDDVQYADRFGLAIHIFQFLMEGNHPFQAVGSDAMKGKHAKLIEENPFPYKDPEPGTLVPPDRAPEYSVLPEELRELFSTCFGYGKRYPKQRPRPEQWVDVLDELTDFSGSGGSAWTPNQQEQRTDRGSSVGQGVSPAVPTDTGGTQAGPSGAGTVDWPTGTGTTQQQTSDESRLAGKAAKTTAIFLCYLVLFLLLGLAVLEFTPV